MSLPRRTLLGALAAFALPAGTAVAEERTEAASAASFSGAGSTFAYAVLAGWSRAFQRSEWTAESQSVGVALDYEPVGSQAGLMRLMDGAVDFAATDVPLSSEELTRYCFGQFPFVIGGVVAAVNLPGVAAGRLKLTGALLADIYLGKVRSWDDAAIKAQNADLTLPGMPVVPVRRSDGSGTTFNVTAYLSKVSPEWKGKVGEGLLVTWPVGEPAKGNDGMAERIKATPGAIGYVDFAQAQKSGLSYASLRNRAGEFVLPSPVSFQAAAARADWTRTQDFQLLVDADGPDAYPLVATTYAVLPADGALTRRQHAVIAFFRWSFANGARLASDLGYVPLPTELVTQTEATWATRRKVRGCGGHRADLT